MAANKRGKIYTMGVGGYRLPEEVVTPKPKPRKAVVPFRRGENGRAISKAEDGILILLERNCSPVPYPGEVWRGTLRAHTSGGFYVFTPEEILKVNPSLRKVPLFVVVRDLATPILLLVRLKFADGLEKVIAVKPDRNQQDILQAEQLQKVAQRFKLSQNSLTYNEVQRRIKSLKSIYDVRYNEEALKNLFKGLTLLETTETTTPAPAHSHNAVNRWMISKIFKEGSGQLVISTQCRLCGKYSIREFQKFSAMDRRFGLFKKKYGRGRFTPKLKKSRYPQNRSMKNLHRKTVVHNKKRNLRKSFRR